MPVYSDHKCSKNTLYYLTIIKQRILLILLVLRNCQIHVHLPIHYKIIQTNDFENVWQAN